MSEATTIRVSRSTLNMLERLRKKFKVKSLDDTIKALIRQQSKVLIDKAFGLDKGRIRAFSEEDRGEDRG